MRIVKIISAKPLSFKSYLSELLNYKSMILVFTQQELKTTYAQTYFGIFWAIIRPIFTLCVFTVIFRFFLHVPTESPYFLFAFAGMIAWNLFSQIASNASTAVLQQQNLIRKMYFPKLILPLSKVLIALVETVISLIILFLFMFISKLGLSVSMVYLPLFMILNVVCGFAIAIWVNTINIRFRDLNQILPTVISIGIWVTPVFYPTSIIPKGYEFFLYLNPMAGIIKGYRFSILGEPFPEQAYWWSIGLVVVIMLAGLWRFSRVEDKMADYA